MKQIDFLPAKYREQTVHRKANVWRVLVAILFVAVLACSACYQQVIRHKTALESGRIGTQYDQAQLLSAKLAALRQRLQDADAEAELLTYLRHPWPSTQVLAAALNPMPDCITLGEVRLFHEQPETSISTALAPPALKKSTDSEPATGARKPSAAARDLAALREEYDSRPMVLLLTGVTSNTAELQRYLVMLAEVPLFSKAELTSLESDGAEQPGVLHFTARLLMRPGYDQPAGPAIGNPEKFAIAPDGKSAQRAVPARNFDQGPAAKSVAANR
jgi:Tfp pilus assembly protein PilN